MPLLSDDNFPMPEAYYEMQREIEMAVLRNEATNLMTWGGYSAYYLDQIMTYYRSLHYRGPLSRTQIGIMWELEDGWTKAKYLPSLRGIFTSDQAVSSEAPEGS